MASCEEAACLLGIMDYVVSLAEPHVEHEAVNQKQEAGLCHKSSKLFVGMDVQHKESIDIAVAGGNR